MTSYYSKVKDFAGNLAANTTSKLVSNEKDGTNEFDTAIARSLRNYYAEKQKPWPATWRDGDELDRKTLDIYDPALVRPDAPAQAVLVPPSNYGGGPPRSNNSSARWQQQDQQYQQQAPSPSQSLRNPRAAAQSVRPTPLPSQRGDSYQKNNLDGYSQNSNPAPPPRLSAKDKLKAGDFRRPAARSNSPANNSAPVSRNNSYGASSMNGGGSRGNYEDNFAPGNYTGGGGGGDKPMVSANAPWSGSDDFSGYGGYEPAPPRQQQPQRMGLPSGPKVMKRY